MPRGENQEQPEPKMSGTKWVSGQQMRAFTKAYAKPISSLVELRNQMASQVPDSALRDAGHYMQVAAYLHHLGYQSPVVLSALSHGLSGDHLARFCDRVPEHAGDVMKLNGYYRRITNSEGTNINVQMATATNDPYALAASTIRAVDLLHTLEDKYSDADYPQLVRDLYMPLHTYFIPHERLATDLGDELARLTFNHHLQDGGAFHETVQRLLLGHTIEAEARLMHVTEGIEDLLSGAGTKFTNEKRVKSMHSIANKIERYILENSRDRRLRGAAGWSDIVNRIGTADAKAEASRALGDIQDIYGIRMLIDKHPNETEERLTERIQRHAAEIAEYLRNQGANVSEIEDYAASPKQTGYKAIHIHFEYGGIKTELQLLSKHWHEMAETSTEPGRTTWRPVYKYPTLAKLRPGLIEQLRSIQQASEENEEGVGLEKFRELFKKTGRARLFEQRHGWFGRGRR